MIQPSMKLLLAFILLIAACTITGEEYSTATVTVTNSQQDEFTFIVEVPLTQEGFAQGLMFRESLDDNKGMLFAFDSSSPKSFWMKNTLIPLDIIFIDENFVIKRIHHAVPCVEEPCPRYISGVPVQYVLELQGNLTIENNIKEGNALKIEFEE